VTRLAGKVALVTGAARGTGAAIAARFAEEGAHVIATDVAAGAKGEDIARLDVTSEQDWARVVGELDRLDVLVNNAAVLHLTSIENTTPDIFEKVLRVNAFGAFLGIRACMPLLRQGGGSIVNIGSIDSVWAVPGTVAYTASKFAMRGITKVAALEGGKDGVRCNIVCPAAGNAEMYTSLVGPPLDLSKATGDRPPSPPLGRSRGPADVVGAALFFASDDSRFVTGTELVIDGGMSAGEYVSVPGQFTKP
jgi:3alpha(or 20beta)-hydroxysteroid dehydrogenase